MPITKIDLNTIGSKIKVAESGDVGKTDAVDQGAKVQETRLSKVEFSENAKIFMEAVEAVKNAPDVRLDRIAELKAAIESGTYKIDSVKLAAKMLHTHLIEQ